MDDEMYYALLERLVSDLRDVSGTFYDGDEVSGYDVAELIEGVLRRKASREEV